MPVPAADEKRVGDYIAASLKSLNQAVKTSLFETEQQTDHQESGLRPLLADELVSGRPARPSARTQAKGAGGVICQRTADS